MASAYEAFEEGFGIITQGTAIVLFRAEELMMLVRGSPSMDFKDLEKSTKYDGFEPEDEIIKQFWEIGNSLLTTIVHEFDDDQKKLLLFFSTGSDRVISIDFRYL
jgi:ubiquitin-protein ligase E3 A